ncbi:MAG: hypothetical protein NT013_17830 [Planctomycetia bacterium]|nr:hypothetical protein [Planctomycetia bacterium]
MPAHRIHLKGPWEVRRLDRDEPLIRVIMPTTWEAIFGEDAGRAEFRRKFNQPTNLEPHEHVWIVFDGIGGEGLARLNGFTLGPIDRTTPTAEFEITQLLALHNELSVELDVKSEQVAESLNGLWGLIALEIRFDER